MDRRALVGLFSGAAGLALGAAAVALGSALLGVVAAVCALAAAGLCVVVASRLRQHHGTAEGLRREILQLEDALLAEREALQDGVLPRRLVRTEQRREEVKLGLKVPWRRRRNPS